MPGLAARIRIAMLLSVSFLIRTTPALPMDGSNTWVTTGFEGFSEGAFDARGRERDI